jgi:hypothetical protein
LNDIHAELLAKALDKILGKHRIKGQADYWQQNPAGNKTLPALPNQTKPGLYE